MADSAKQEAKKARGGRYCTAGAPNNESCKNSGKTEGIKMYPADFKHPTLKYTLLCSAHFEDSCYEHKLSVIDSIEQSGGVKVRGYFKRTAASTRDTVVPTGPEVPVSDRNDKRNISHVFPITIFVQFL